MWSRARSQSGSLKELRMTAAILAVLLVGFSLFKYGASVTALKVIIGVPLAFVGWAVVMSLVAMSGVGFARRRTRRQLAWIRRAGLAGNLEEMKTALAGIAEREAVGEECELLRTDIVVETARSGPLRPCWLALYDLLPGVDAGEAKALLVEPESWPREVQETVLRAAPTHEARIALASVFLAREEDAALRRAMLHLLFYRSPMAPDPPSPEWIEALARYDADLAELERAESNRGAAGVAPHVRKYREAIAAVAPSRAR